MSSPRCSVSCSKAEFRTPLPGAYNRYSLNEPHPRPSDLPMAVSGGKRFDDDKVVRYETAVKDFEVEVSRTLNKWCVTVYQQPDCKIVVEDFFSQRRRPIAGAPALLRIL